MNSVTFPVITVNAEADPTESKEAQAMALSRRFMVRTALWVVVGDFLNKWVRRQGERGGSSREGRSDKLL